MNLHEKYTPKNIGDIFGQKDTVAQFRNIKKQLANGESVSQCYCFSGKYGIGKSAMAKILAEILGCNIRWYNSAHTNGVDFARNFAATVLPFSRGFDNRPTAYIIEEAHRMTKPAQENLLVPLEKEIPEGSAVIFTTTEPEELGCIINSGRARHFELKPLSVDDLCALLNKVVTAEGFVIDDDIITRIAHGSNGSARVALQNLEFVAAMPAANRATWTPSTLDGAETPNSLSLRDALTNATKGVALETAWTDVANALKKIKEAGDEVEGVRRFLIGTFAGRLVSPAPPCVATRRVDFFALTVFNQRSYYDCGYAGLVEHCREFLQGIQKPAK